MPALFRKEQSLWAIAEERPGKGSPQSQPIPLGKPCNVNGFV